MPALRSRVVRAVVAALVLPHEAAHALPAWLAGLDAEVTVLPAWDGAARPLGRFNAATDEATPSWLIRLVAVAPLPVYVGLAAVVGRVVPAESALAVPCVGALSFWASLSRGDLAVAANPDAVRASGEFLAPGTGGQAALATALTPLTLAVVAVLVLGT